MARRVPYTELGGPSVANRSVLPDSKYRLPPTCNPVTARSAHAQRQHAPAPCPASRKEPPPLGQFQMQRTAIEEPRHRRSEGPAYPARDSGRWPRTPPGVSDTAAGGPPHGILSSVAHGTNAGGNASAGGQVRVWLGAERELNVRTVDSRISNCRQVERCEGDLDAHYDADGLTGLMDRLNPDRRVLRAFEGDVDKGTRCSSPVFMRSAGMRHSRSSSSISVQVAPPTSPERQAVSTRNRKHAFADNDARDASTMSSAAPTSW